MSATNKTKLSANRSLNNSIDNNNNTNSVNNRTFKTRPRANSLTNKQRVSATPRLNTFLHSSYNGNNNNSTDNNRSSVSDATNQNASPQTPKGSGVSKVRSRRNSIDQNNKKVNLNNSFNKNNNSNISERNSVVHRRASSVPVLDGQRTSVHSRTRRSSLRSNGAPDSVTTPNSYVDPSNHSNSNISAATTTTIANTNNNSTKSVPPTLTAATLSTSNAREDNGHASPRVLKKPPLTPRNPFSSSSFSVSHTNNSTAAVNGNSSTSAAVASNETNSTSSSSSPVLAAPSVPANAKRKSTTPIVKRPSPTTVLSNSNSSSHLSRSSSTFQRQGSGSVNANIHGANNNNTSNNVNAATPLDKPWLMPPPAKGILKFKKGGRNISLVNVNQRRVKFDENNVRLTLHNSLSNPRSGLLSRSPFMRHAYAESSETMGKGNDDSTSLINRRRDSDDGPKLNFLHDRELGMSFDNVDIKSLEDSPSKNAKQSSAEWEEEDSEYFNEQFGITSGKKSPTVSTKENEANTKTTPTLLSTPRRSSSPVLHCPPPSAERNRSAITAAAGTVLPPPGTIEELHTSPARSSTPAGKQLHTSTEETQPADTAQEMPLTASERRLLRAVVMSKRADKQKSNAATTTTSDSPVAVTGVSAADATAKPALIVVSTRGRGGSGSPASKPQPAPTATANNNHSREEGSNVVTPSKERSPSVPVESRQSETSRTNREIIMKRSPSASNRKPTISQIIFGRGRNTETNASTDINEEEVNRTQSVNHNESKPIKEPSTVSNTNNQGDTFEKYVSSDDEDPWEFEEADYSDKNTYYHKMPSDLNGSYTNKTTTGGNSNSNRSNTNNDTNNNSGVHKVSTAAPPAQGSPSKTRLFVQRNNNATAANNNNNNNINLAETVTETTPRMIVPMPTPRTSK